MGISNLIFIPFGLYASFNCLRLGVNGAIKGRLSMSYDYLLGIRPSNNKTKSNPNYFTGFKARFYGSFFLLAGLYFSWATIDSLLKLVNH